jgi:YHS domain-containing protein
MVNARDIVERYLGAFYGGDSQEARRCLADDLTFSGPAVAFSTADAYLKAAAHARRAAKGVEKRKVFADGPDVCIFYDLLIDHPVGSVPIAEWYHLDGDKIVAIRSILDTAPFAARAGAQRGETALDPVCHMTVQKASAPATRSYEGTAYYFCSAGCAEAFEKEPESFL